MHLLIIYFYLFSFLGRVVTGFVWLCFIMCGCWWCTRDSYILCCICLIFPGSMCHNSIWECGVEVSRDAKTHFISISILDKWPICTRYYQGQDYMSALCHKPQSEYIINHGMNRPGSEFCWWAFQFIMYLDTHMCILFLRTVLSKGATAVL